MKRIWKYTLNSDVIQKIDMPYKSQILCAGLQESHICIWVLFDDMYVGLGLKKREIEIVGTGNPNSLSDQSKFIGFVQIPPYVSHVFDNGVVE